MNQPTLHVQSSIDVRALVKILRKFNEQGISHYSSWSHVIRECIESLAGDVSAISIKDSVNYIRNEGFSVRQLHNRGEGIREHIKLEGDEEELGNIMEAMSKAEKEK